MPGAPVARSSSGLGASGSRDQSLPLVPTSIASGSGPWPAVARHAAASNSYSVTTTIEPPALRVAAFATAGPLVSHPAAVSESWLIRPGVRVDAASGNGSGSRPRTWSARQERPPALARVATEVG